MENFSRAKAPFWERAPFFRILLPFIAGILCYDRFHLYHINPYWWTGAVCVTVLSAGMLHLAKGRRYSYLSDAFLIASLLLLALLVSAFQDARTAKRWMGHALEKAVAWEAVVTAPPLEKEKTIKLSLDVKQYADSNGSSGPASGKAFLYVYKDSSGVAFRVREGDRILVANKIQPIRNAGNPFEMDYAQYAARNSFYFQQFSSRHDVYILSHNNRLTLLQRSHNWCNEQLVKCIRDTATQGILQAMLLGDEAYLDKDLRQAYSQTGIIHIISISGSHVAVFFVLISGMLWWLRHKKYTPLKYLLAIVPVWFYVLMAGGPPSALRAAVMFTLLAAGQVFNKSNNPLNTLLAAAFVLLLIQPAWLFSVGFQLSFIAVLSLIIFYRPVAGWYRPQNAILNKIWQAIAASLAAEILVAPLVAYYFHSFPAMFLFANLIAYLLMGVLLVAGLSILVFAWLPWLAGCIAAFCVFITVTFNEAIAFLQAFSPAYLNRLNVSFAELLLIYGVIAFAGIWLLQGRRRAVWGMLAAVCLLLGLFCRDEWVTLRRKELVVYNTGRKNYAELICGKTSAVFSGDKGADSSYAIQAAHTGYCISQVIRPAAPVALIKGKTVLVLDAAGIDTAQRFPVDVLVLARPLKGLSFPGIRRVFRPRMIILPSGQSKWYAARWQDSCKAYGISVHNTAASGAYILQD